MSQPDRPYFRFVPGAFENNLCFERSDKKCDICAKACLWKYNGNIYAVNDPDTVCARCIADGNLAKHFGAETFGLHDMEVDISPPLWEEINHRTPGIPTYNAITWPVINGVPCAFVAAGDSSDFPRGSDVDAAVADAWRERGLGDQGALRYILLFRQMNGKDYRAVVDLD